MPVAWERGSHVAPHLDTHGIAPAIPLLRREGPPHPGRGDHRSVGQPHDSTGVEDVKLAAAPRAKLQATGIDSAGRRRYRYHPDFRARQEAAKFQQLIRFAEKLPDLRLAMGERQTERSAP